MRALWLVEDRENLRHWLAEPSGDAVAVPKYPPRWFREDAPLFAEYCAQAMEWGDPLSSTEELLDEPRTRVVAEWTEEEVVRPHGDPLDPEAMLPATAQYLGPDAYRHLTPGRFRILLVATEWVRSQDDRISRSIATALLEASPAQLAAIGTNVLARLLASPDAALRAAAMRVAPRTMPLSRSYRSRLPR